MKITRFYEQNYGPFSNELIDIPISDDPELIQLLGSNGHGKSTLLRGFSVAGYGETSGITASDIANSINGKCITGICTEIKGVPWRIERGFSPNFVKVYRGDNTKPEDFGGIDATKNKIKKEIMDVPYYIFSSILSLSINDFKSFMTMQPKDSKNIRDRIFGFYVLNEMYDRVNKEYLSLEKEYESLNFSLSSKKDNLTSLNEEYEKLKENIKTEIQGKLTSLKQEFDQLKLEVADKKIQLGTLQEIHTQLLADKKQYELLEDYEFNLQAEEVIKQLNLRIEELDISIKSKETERGQNIRFTSEYEKYQMFLRSEEAKMRIIDLDLSLSTNKALLSDLENFKKASNIVNIDTTLKSKSNDLDALKIKSTEFHTKYDAGKQALNSRLQLISDKKAALKEATRKIELYKQGVCPTCDTEFTDDKHKHKLQEFENEEASLKEEISTEERKYQELDTKLTNGKQVGSSIDTKISLLEREIEELKNRLVGADLSWASNYVENWNNPYSSVPTDDVVDTEISRIQNENIQITNDKSKYSAQLVDFRFEEPVKEPDTEAIEKLNSKLHAEKTEYNEKSKEAAYQKGTLKSIPADFVPDKEISNKLFAVDLPITEEKITEINTFISEKNYRLKTIVDESGLLKTQLGNSEVKSMEEMIQRSQNDINIIESELNDKKQLINYKKIQKHSLSDDGIKSNIIREFVPFINSQIQSIVANFDIGLSLYFDAEFKAHIFRMGKEVSIKTISTGQKKILDFAILITMTKILKLKYPDINLIFYDEIFSSIHPNNRIVILDIIDKEIRLGLKMNVVVVSHTHLPESYFQKFIEIYKENNFSKIKITTAA